MLCPPPWYPRLGKEHPRKLRNEAMVSSGLTPSGAGSFLQTSAVPCATKATARAAPQPGRALRGGCFSGGLWGSSCRGTRSPTRAPLHLPQSFHPLPRPAQAPNPRQQTPPFTPRPFCPSLFFTPPFPSDFFRDVRHRPAQRRSLGARSRSPSPPQAT